MDVLQIYHDVCLNWTKLDQTYDAHPRHVRRIVEDMRKLCGDTNVLPT